MCVCVWERERERGNKWAIRIIVNIHLRTVLQQKFDLVWLYQSVADDDDGIVVVADVAVAVDGDAVVVVGDDDGDGGDW